MHPCIARCAAMVLLDHSLAGPRRSRHREDRLYNVFSAGLKGLLLASRKLIRRTPPYLHSFAEERYEIPWIRCGPLASANGSRRISWRSGFNASHWSKFSRSDVDADDTQIVASGFERLLSVVVRNESGVVIKCHISLPPETVEDCQKASMFLVDARSDEINNRDVVSGLAPGAKAIAEHETERGF
jgi:hypothetical protein